MDIEKLNQLADVIENNTLNRIFSMNRVGTCIISHAVELWQGNKYSYIFRSETENFNIDDVFMPEGWQDQEYCDTHYDRKQTARMLRKLAATGIVDWKA